MSGYKHKGGYERHKDLTGKRFGNLTVISIPVMKRGERRSEESKIAI